MTPEKVEKMEILALEAMGLHDVDEMYGRLWREVKKLKKIGNDFFQDCTKESEELHLLYRYVTWANHDEDSHVVNLCL